MLSCRFLQIACCSFSLQKLKRTAGCCPIDRFIREGNGTPLQYSCLENPMDRPQQWLTTASDRASVGANASALFLRSQHHHEDLTSAHSGNLHIRAMKRRHHHSHFTGDQSETQRGSRAPSNPTQDTFSLGLLGPFLSCYFSCSCRTQLHQLGLHTAIQLDKAASGFKALSDFRAVWHQEGPRQKMGSGSEKNRGLIWPHESRCNLK